MNKVMMDLMTVLQTDNFIDDTEYMLFQVSQHLLKMLDFDNIEGKGKKKAYCHQNNNLELHKT